MTFLVKWHGSSPQQRTRAESRTIDRFQSLLIGRDGGADIVLDDPLVSRVHAEVFVEQDMVFVRDAGSVNGIRLDGKRLQDSPWLPGQTLVIGSFLFQLEPQGAISALATVGASGIAAEQSPTPFQQRRLPARGEFSPLLIDRARSNDKTAIERLFSGYLSHTESVLDCGCLGTIGLVLADTSFWCITDQRVCGITIGADGQHSFNFMFTKTLSRAELTRYSDISLFGALTGFCFGGVAAAAVVASLVQWLTRSPFLGALTLVAILVTLAVALPLAQRYIYHVTRTGCTLFGADTEPVVLPAGRDGNAEAQRLMSALAERNRVPVSF